MVLLEMPKANENMTEATLDRWLVKEGQAIAQNQALCEIITDKAKFEYPSPMGGVMLKIIGLERALLPVGYVLGVVGQAGEPVPEGLDARNEALLASHRSAVVSFQSAPAAAPVQASAGSGIRATPAARRLAREAGVDLAAVAQKYSLAGPVGEKDVQRYLDERNAL